MNSPPIFIADQRIYALRPLANRQVRDALALHHLPEFESLEQSYAKWKRDETPSSRWLALDTPQERRDFLLDLGGNSNRNVERRLLCITSSAGIGKSIALQQAGYLRNQLQGHLVIEYHFSQLPINAKSFFEHPGDAAQHSLLQRIEASLRGMPGSIPSSQDPVHDGYRAGVHAWLKKKIKEGNVTLLVDGLDELDSKEGALRAMALRELLHEYKELHCMVAGRPYAIVDDYWNALFAESATISRTDQHSTWQFCSVGMFDPAQIRRSLGPARAAQLESLASEMELTPRTIEVLRGLTLEQFQRLHTVADVYWESLKRTLEWDVDRKKKGLQHGYVSKITAEQYVDYVSALAITMFLDEARETGLQEVQASLLERLQTLPAWRNEGLQQLTEKQNAIRELNAGCIEFRVFDTFDTQVKWRNNTLRDFYAALWLVRHSSPDERIVLSKKIPKRFTIVKKHSSIEPSNQEVWSFLSSMPAGALVGNRNTKFDRWLDLMAYLFQRPSAAPRPTEMMARAWLGLLITAGYLDSNQRNAADEQRATELATDAAQKYGAVAGTNAEAKAKSILQTFLREFLDASQCADGRTVIEADLVFHEIPPPTSGWNQVPVGHGDEMDNPPRNIALRGPYRVCAFPITRRMYRLFDPRHEHHHAKDFQSYCKDDRCPAIDITWWDAKMFAIWSHSRLMTEWEWEHACRANCIDRDGTPSKYYWPEDPKGNKLVDHAWTSENSQHQTHVVAGKPGNTFQLHDMLGNVWEWTESCYKPQSVFRVLRGGSFVDDGRGATVSYRSLNDPSDAYHDIGCRVARASLRKP